MKQRQTPSFLPGMEPISKQATLDFSGIDDDSFFHEAEARIIEALRAFAETATGSATVRRKLFVGDAAQGIAFIDILRTRFDVLLMNPPFGDATPTTVEYLERHYFDTRLDLFAAFSARLLTLACPRGLIGAITPRDGFFKKTLGGWREIVLQNHMTVVADLGIGVLDSATVRVAAYVIAHEPSDKLTRFIDLVDLPNREDRLRVEVKTPQRVYDVPLSSFRLLPLSRFLYWLPARIWEIFTSADPLENGACTPRYGLTTLNDERFCRLSSLHQTHIYSEIVAEQPKPVAYFLVDAMRFEMGVELADRLPKTTEVIVRPAICALPSITPIGMAALQPGASSSFSVVEQGGTLGVRIDAAFLPDLTARKKFAAARVPNLADVSLDELLSLQPSKLARKIDGAQVVVVRSQEIDHAGETGFTFQARQVMDTVIDNLARAIRKLAAAGVEQAVVTADHGHLFFPSDRDESMRIASPGGGEVDLHRRCWIGRGGSTPAGCVRVSAAALGYDSDLDFVFPLGTGVFKAGGDLAFHHGGPSLQELVIPVLTVRMKTPRPERSTAGSVTVTGLPDAVTNRIFSVTIQLDGKNLSLFSTELVVRPLLISSGKQVGGVGMAINAELDQVTGCIKLQPGKPVTVAFLLSDESIASLRVVVQDPTTDAELYRSPNDIPVRLGV